MPATPSSSCAVRLRNWFNHALTASASLAACSRSRQVGSSCSIASNFSAQDLVNADGLEGVPAESEVSIPSDELLGVAMGATPPSASTVSTTLGVA